MGIEITRRELFEKVWSETFTALAPQFNVSGSYLSRACRKSNIPKPGPGYWAKIKAGKKVHKMDLPPRFPGSSDVIVFGNGWDVSPVDDNDDLPIPPPPKYEESLEDLRDRVIKIVGKVKNTQIKLNSHHIIQKILDKDNERRRNSKENGYTWDLPKFDSLLEKRRLRILNALFTAARRIGCQSNITTGRFDEDLEPSIYIGSQYVSFKLEYNKPSTRGKNTTTNKPKLTLSISGESRKPSRISWTDTDDEKIESHLTEIMIEILLTGEIKYREHIQWGYDWSITRREERIEAKRLQKLEEERLARELKEKLDQARIDKLLFEASSLQKAEVIRAYVKSIRFNSVSIEASMDDIESWAEWALEQADRIDPIRSCSFLTPTTI